MKKRSIIHIEVDDQGNFIIPAEVAKRYGLASQAIVRLEEDSAGFRISRNPNSLRRIYVEPTTLCNLDCATCMRNVWNETSGHMSEAVFERILEGIREIQPAPCVFFGGYGEPLTHPHIVEWVAQVHQAGAQVELITNGILLSPDCTRQLAESGLDRIWVSIDGATPEGYADIRLGDELPVVIQNLQNLQRQRYLRQNYPLLGIAIVAMKRNLAELPEIINLGRRLGADQFSITNVYPHTSELREEILFSQSLYENAPNSYGNSLIALPRADITPISANLLGTLARTGLPLSFARQGFNPGTDSCPFLEKGSVSVRWDGAVSPCLALLHTHDSYLDDRLRRSYAYTIGNLSEQKLEEIWEEPAYVVFRERLLQFDFSFCTYCNSCDMADSNLEDCFGNTHPTCGGCLWAQGFIQCP